jgi:hypothetical protein
VKLHQVVLVVGFGALSLSLSREPKRVEVPFDPHALLEDKAFRDTEAVDAGDLELFLARTPHGGRSVLASVREAGGRSAAMVILAEARRAGVNPLVLLAKAQVEQSLVSRKRAPLRSLDRALGCRCPEGGRCDPAAKGFGRQVRCAAEHLAAYFRELSDRGASRSLWRVGAPRRAACGGVVSPSSRATASLYTYTPYVLEGRGGNWLFHRVFRRYALYLGYYPESR